jgi:hypothetical protein
MEPYNYQKRRITRYVSTKETKKIRLYWMQIQNPEEECKIIADFGNYMRCTFDEATLIGYLNYRSLYIYTLTLNIRKNSYNQWLYTFNGIEFESSNDGDYNLIISQSNRQRPYDYKELKTQKMQLDYENTPGHNFLFGVKCSRDTNMEPPGKM